MNRIRATVLSFGLLVALVPACSEQEPRTQATRRRTPREAQYPAELLALGQVAPDIIGEDFDGHAMKLSDYRGKIVLLDFWGHW